MGSDSPDRTAAREPAFANAEAIGPVTSRAGRFGAGALRLALPLLVPLLGGLIALVLGAVIIVASGSDPRAAYGALLDGAFGSRWAIGFTLLSSIPLIVTAAGIALALRAGVLNLAAEGEIYLGALGTTVVATTLLVGQPGFVQIAGSLAAGVVCGTLLGIVPGILRAAWNVSEIVVGLMLSFIAILATSYVVHGPLLQPNATYPQSRRVSDAAMLPTLWPGTRLTIGIVIALGIAVLTWAALRWTVFGWKIRVSGLNPRAARLAGHSPARMIVVAMAISGGAAGLAGGLVILGDQGRLVENFSPWYGFQALQVALLAQLHPLGVVPASIFFAALSSGGGALERGAGVPNPLASIIQAVAVLSVIAFSGGLLRKLLVSSVRDNFRRGGGHADG